MLFRKKDFLSWDNYQERIETLDLIAWQQHTRRQSLRNALAQES